MLTIGKAVSTKSKQRFRKAPLFIIVLCWQTRCKAQQTESVLSYGHGNFLGRDHNCDANRLYH